MQPIPLFPKLFDLNILYKLALSFLIVSSVNISKVCAQEFDASFQHQALVVSDLNASAIFYREVLGLQEIKNETQKPTRRWFSLGDNLELHLLQDNMEGVKVNKSIHTAVAISDFDAFVESLRSRDIPFSDWPGNVNQVNIRPDGVKQVYIQDPDGYWIEINSKLD